MVVLPSFFVAGNDSIILRPLKRIKRILKDHLLRLRLHGGRVTLLGGFPSVQVNRASDNSEPFSIINK